MRAAVLWLGLCLPAAAAPVDDLVTATERLDTARALLEASLADDPLPALASVVKAYDEALAQVRAAERETMIVRGRVQAALDARGAELSKVLAALQAAGGPTTAERILHPAGPLGAARAAMLMSAAAPQIEEETSTARAELEDLKALDAAMEAAKMRLQSGADEARHARLALSARAKAETPVAEAALTHLSEAASSLQDLALALAESPVTGAVGEAAAPGGWSLPVRGAVLRGFGEPDAGGTPRPGLVIAAAAGAILTAPAPMTVRFVGRIRGYGNVMILEPGPGYLLVLTGFGEAFVGQGQVLPAGAPLGLMGETGDRTPAVGGEAVALTLTQTLYVETRVAGESEDPAAWFAFNKD